MDTTQPIQIVKLEDSQLQLIKDTYHKDYDFAFIMIFVLIGVILGYIGMKGVLSPWK